MFWHLKQIFKDFFSKSSLSTYLEYRMSMVHSKYVNTTMFNRQASLLWKIDMVYIFGHAIDTCHMANWNMAIHEIFLLVKIGC